MRVLIVTDWNRSHGGAEAYIGWLRAGLESAGDEVRLLTSSAGSAADGTADYVAFGTERIAAQAFLQIANPSAVRQVRSALAGFRPDVVFVNMFALHLSPAILYCMGDVPVVLSVSDYKCVCPIGTKLQPDGSICGVQAGIVCHGVGCVSLLHWLRDRPRYAMIRAGVAKVDRVLACSLWVQAELAKAGIESELLMLPVLSPSPGYRRAPADEPLFLYCGRLDIEKGVENLVHAFAPVREEIPTARLRVAGQGPERPRLERLTQTLGLEHSIEFTGWLSPTQIEAELARAWVLVAPGLWAEPLGFVAIEAILRGVPVIASAIGGFAETVMEGVSGLLVPNGSVESLAQRMLDIAHQRAFPGHCVPEHAVLQLAERAGMQRHIGRMREIFSEIA